MKRCIAAAAAVLALILGTSAFARGEIEVRIDGNEIHGEAEPVNTDGRVLVPIRAVFEALGASVSWDETERKVYSERGSDFMELTVDSPMMRCGIFNSDGARVWTDEIALDVPTMIINDYTYVPIRAVSETLGASVKWNGEDNSVDIHTYGAVDKPVYYTSLSDYGKLYVFTPDGERRRLSNKPARDLEMCGNYVYYTSGDTGFLYRADAYDGEELILNRSADKIAVDDGYAYYRDNEDGVLYRINIDSRDIERLTDNPVYYPRLYRDRLYFNLDGDNRLYALTRDGKQLSIIDIGDSAYTRLNSFNCVFSGDYIFIENGMWYGNLMRVNLDGSDVRILTNCNSIICDASGVNDKIVYKSPDNGQDIFCVNTDGTDNHLVHEGDDSWLDIDVIARDGDTIYYKNPMRMEVYRVNLDTSGDAYVCYADDVKVGADRIVASYEGLYSIAKDGSQSAQIYEGNVSGFKIFDETVFFTDAKSGRLYASDYYGNVSALSGGETGEWIY